MKKGIARKYFGEYVCTDKVLRKHMLPWDYKKYKEIKEAGLPMEKRLARKVAEAMKKWAFSKGASHFSHWFSPLTGKTAEKQVSFLERDKNGNALEVFDEKSLIKSEADASSFPNGGERMTFEARGYIMWDYTSPAFIKEDKSGNKTLYIPTAFCSYNGTALDEKTPLLRATQNLSNETVKLLHLLGFLDVKKAICNIGGEQEYFLIRKTDFDKRLDLKLTGRTLLGAEPIKSQENCSHYFGIIDDEISAFMNEVDRELWKLGIMTKIRHNEVAPCQRELVPFYTPANISCDQNELLMEVINKVAKRHGFEALFHESPFAGINGSGKHINWSISTDTGINLFDSNIEDKRLFLLFFTAMIASVHKNYKLIRASMAHRGNDLRLGGNEAPPRIISMFVGENIEKLIESFGDDSKIGHKIMSVGVETISDYEKDYCDRNRTTPVSYNGNKIEFRMVGSSVNMSWPSTCITAGLVNEIKIITKRLEKCENIENEIIKIVKENYENHKAIIFNGNGYDKAWREEAKRRGLEELVDSLSCYKVYDTKEARELLSETGVLSENEIDVRKLVYTKAYTETVLIEAKTMTKMLMREVYPRTNSYLGELSKSSEFDGSEFNSRKKIERQITSLLDAIMLKCEYLENLINKIKTHHEKKEDLIFEILDVMVETRNIYDKLEPMIPKEYMAFPTYDEILF